MHSILSTFLTTALSVCFLFQASGQNPGLNMSLLGHWDVDTLPVHSGIKYNDVWGYADCSGREYAILGSARRIHFIDVTKPDEPREIASFAGTANSIWRDFKTYRDRAYACADQGQDGLMVFDMSRLPDTVIKTYQSTQYFSRSHNLWVDTLQGRLYMAGSNTRSNGVIIFDLTANPDQPTLLASVPLPGGYIHDIHVVNNIAYCSHGGNGLWVYDLSNPQNPVTLGSMTDYPERGYNHSSWLTRDGQFLIMADETHGTSLKVVDVQDFNDIYVRSLFKSALLAPGNTGSIVHNPFIRDQYVILAYYHEGIQIYDMSDPSNVVRAAYFDTYPINTNYNGYEGAWGTYPFLPSGNILGSDITFGLFVLRADSITFQPGPRHRYPDAVIATVNPAFCEGSTVQLAAAAGAESYTWFLDGAPVHGGSPSLTVGLDGYYQVEARNGHCVSRSDSVWVGEVQSPVVDIAVEVPAFCPGDSARLDVAGNADSVFLYRADGFRALVEVSYLLREGGVYGIEAQRGPCVVRADSVLVIMVFQPISPLVEQSGGALICTNAASFLHFQWYRNGVFLTNANSATLQAMESGAYTLEAIDANGCYSVSEAVQVVISAVGEPVNQAFSIYPNPVTRNGKITLECTATGTEWGAAQLSIRDALGRMVQRSLLQTANQQEISLNFLAPGVYFYEITTGKGQRLGMGKLVLMR